MSSLGPRLDRRNSSDGEFNHLISSTGFNDLSAFTASPSGFVGSFIGKRVLKVSSESIGKILLDFEIGSLCFFFLVGGASSSKEVVFFFPMMLQW